MLYKNDLSRTDETFRNLSPAERKEVGTNETRIVPVNYAPPSFTTSSSPSKSRIVLKDRTIKGPIGITCHLCGQEYRGTNYDLHLKACHRR